MLRLAIRQAMQATGVLHQSLLEQIYEINWPSYITRDKAIAFLQSLTRKRHMENTHTHEYTDMAYVYFLQKLGSKYRQIIKPLLSAGILQSTEYYRPGWYNDEMEYVKGQCLSYRINPELLDDQVVKVVYRGEQKRQRCRDKVTMTSKQIMRQIRIPDMNSRQLINFVKLSLTDERIRKMIKVNTPDGSVKEIVEEVVKLKVESVKADLRISYRHVRVADLQLRTKCLIKDGKQYHIEHLDTYIKRKRRHLTQAYCDQLLRIKHRNIYADRNDTNLRLDSNLTNLKSDFMSLLAIDGQRLSQIDLKNSQFRFFVMLLEQCERQIMFGRKRDVNLFTEYMSAETAKSEFKVRLKGGKEIEGKPVTLLSILFDEFCIKKDGLSRSLTTDYKRFRKLVKTGQLYEYIQKVYWSETGVEISRAEAKKIMFTVAFSSYRYCPIGKQVLQKYLPSIVSVIDGFKKARIAQLANEELRINNETLCPADIQPKADRLLKRENKASAHARDKGNASFAVMLQQVESVVFVDKILSECHLRRLKVLSKHDSIICRQSDKRLVTGIICRIMNQIFGKATYSLDVDGEVFKIPKKRKSRLGRVATEVVHTLFGLTYMANAPPGRVSSSEYRVSSKNTPYPLQGEITEGQRRKVSKRGDLYTGSVALYPTDAGIGGSNPSSSTSQDGYKIKSERVRRLRDKLMGR